MAREDEDVVETPADGSFATVRVEVRVVSKTRPRQEVLKFVPRSPRLSENDVMAFFPRFPHGEHSRSPRQQNPSNQESAAEQRGVKCGRLVSCLRERNHAGYICALMMMAASELGPGFAGSRGAAGACRRRARHGGEKRVAGDGGGTRARLLACEVEKGSGEVKDLI
ncbi:hypothetical protein EJ06DRAFT_301768 [Trichodelitschia bisporula]|uniref:Uncharacterized protein n=1 Tax=Trichodelitschia bisporula TaxID=703511 RepID=A0A6G1I7H8_9PEZI|nr:hypothetical protein EJ06DRAFT_301768 [Trichodelitschia bisporula]